MAIITYGIATQLHGTSFFRQPWLAIV